MEKKQQIINYLQKEIEAKRKSINDFLYCIDTWKEKKEDSDFEFIKSIRSVIQTKIIEVSTLEKTLQQIIKIYENAEDVEDSEDSEDVEDSEDSEDVEEYEELLEEDEEDEYF